MRAPRSFQRVDDQSAGVLLHRRIGRTEHRRIAFADHARKSGDNGNVLLAVGLVADDAAVMEDAVVGLPQILAGLGIVRMQPAAGISALSTETICSPKLRPPRWPPPGSRYR